MLIKQLRDVLTMNLKQWRKSKGFTLMEVAKICNKRSPGTVINWEKNGINSAKTQKKLKILSDGLITNFEGEGLNAKET